MAQSQLRHCHEQGTLPIAMQQKDFGDRLQAFDLKIFSSEAAFFLPRLWMA
jgi:hypothetical protein